MAALHLDRARFRVLFVLYASGLTVWLVLGLLPTLVSAVPALHHQFLSWAPTYPFAERILHPAMPGGMVPDMTTTGQALLQYGFSALNFTLGILLAVRLPDQRVPRLLAFALLGTAATFNMPSHRAFHVTGTPWPIVLIHFGFHIVSGTCYFWAVVLFADGELPRQIRPSPAGLRGAVVAVTALVAFISWRGSFLAHPQFFVIFFGIGISVCGVTAQLLRVRDPQSSANDRRTARLLIAALIPALVTALVWLAGKAAGGLGWSGAARFCGHVQVIFPAVFAIVPVVLFAGVVRYRLWDLDRILSRVLTYGAIAAVVVAGYIAAVAVAGSVLGRGLVSTVLVLAVGAVAIEPLRVIAQRWANRVVFGQELTPTEAIRDLVRGLEQLSPTGELDQITELAVRATRATRAVILVHDEAVSVAPVGAQPGDPDRQWPISYQGTELGTLAVSSDAPLPASEVALLADLAAHAGLVLNNAILTVQLAREVADLGERARELRQVRRALVAMQDTERRRLERNLHDGAQQELVAAIAGIGALGTTGGSTELTGQVGEYLTDSRASVLALCGDGQPKVLIEHGLSGALNRAADILAGDGVRTDVEVDAGVLPVDVATGVYFCCIEALQNIGKYARARNASVRVVRRGSEVEVTVRDDGAGFVVDGTGDAGGLAQLADRIAALGGALTIASAPGTGALLQARVPVPA
jgi:signal transduction histidine kinase